MKKSCKNTISGTFDEHVESDSGLSDISCEHIYLVNKPLKAGFSVRAPLLAGRGKNIKKLSAKNWQSWYAEVPTGSAEENSKIKKGALEIKDLIPWVRIIAQKIHRPLPSNIMLNDLVQDGMIGLMNAYSEYDADLGVPFLAFAKNKIRWAIMDGLRAGDWADNHVRGRANKVSKTADKLQALLHRKPSNREIADSLGVRVDDVTAILGEAYGYNFVRINDSFDGEAQDIPDSRMEPSAIVERREAYSRAVASLKILHPNERKAFILRIMCDMSGRQVATEMGVTESRVSQLYKLATEKLASYV